LLVTAAFWDLFPSARIGVVTVHGLDNTVGVEHAATLLAAEASQRAVTLKEGELS
jgi:DNA/RNA-binding domain of Phe-tRNA-synthetase-like protein